MPGRAGARRHKHGLGWGPHIHAAGCPAGQGPDAKNTDWGGGPTPQNTGLGWGPHIHAAGCPAGQGPDAINTAGQGPDAMSRAGPSGPALLTFAVWRTE